MTYGAVVDCETLGVLKQIQTVRKSVSNNILHLDLKLFEMKQKVFHKISNRSCSVQIENMFGETAE